jgi:hypothetical protein
MERSAKVLRFCTIAARWNSSSISAREYRANAKQCLSWSESASDPKNREAFFALAATLDQRCARIEHAARIERSTAAPEIRAAGEPLLRRRPRVK